MPPTDTVIVRIVPSAPRRFVHLLEGKPGIMGDRATVEAACAAAAPDLAACIETDGTTVTLRDDGSDEARTWIAAALPMTGADLRTWRTERRMTREQAAVELRISVSTLGRYERRPDARVPERIVVRAREIPPGHRPSRWMRLPADMVVIEPQGDADGEDLG